MAANNRTISTCPEKQRLSNEFVAAVGEVMSLQSKEMQMVAHRGSGIERFELALDAARRKRDRAKREYRQHLESHGC
jgi:hypothetical protein